MPQTRCLICGKSQNEVEKLHYFPANANKAKIWLEAMGIHSVHSLSLRNHLICCRHFSQDSYTDGVSWKLLRNAVPSLLPSMVGDELAEKLVPVMDMLASGSGVGDGVGIAGVSGVGMVKEGRAEGVTQSAIQDPIPEVMSSPKTSVFRGIKGVSRTNATPRKQKLMRIVESKEVHIRKLKKICKKKARDIKELSDLENSSVVKELFKDMSNAAMDFLISQLRSSKKKPHGRRWTTNEKVMALALYKRGPRCYRLLRKFAALPSKNTLIAMLQKVPFNAGLNEHLFKHVASILKEEEHKYCALLFDEVDIKEHVQYNAHLDCIVGFEQLDGGKTSKKLATKTLVFMLQGLARNWKQPVAYYFSHGPCPADRLQNCIMEVLHACETLAKVNIVTTICDMGSPNVKALKQLGSSVERPYFVVNGKELFTMYDPPHLLKCIVSLFRKHNVLLATQISGESQNMEARFGDIVKAFDIDQQSPLVFRAMHKLKAHHLQPKMQYAMKVNIAAQIMSHTVAAYLYTLLSRGEMEQRTLATATFVSQVDKLFDSFNGSRTYPIDGKEVKCCITKDSAHHQYWNEAFNMIKGWKFQRRLKGGSFNTNRPPSQVGWLTTIKAIKKIWEVLQSKGIKSLRPRALNQDALENLFGGVRGGLGSGHNSTPTQFQASLKTQILNGLVNSKVVGSNCEEDQHQLLSNLTAFLTTEENTASEPPSVDISNLTVAEEIAQDVHEGATSTMSVAYVSGFIAKRLMARNDCETCRVLLLSTSTSPHNLFISFKEWSESERLQYPSEPFVICVGQGITSLESALDKFCDKPSLSTIVTEALMQNMDFTWMSCDSHKGTIMANIVQAVLKIGIPWWCKRKNQQLTQERKDSCENKRKVKTFKHA